MGFSLLQSYFLSFSSWFYFSLPSFLFCFCFVFCYLPKQQCILYLYFVETAIATKTDHQVFILNYFFISPSLAYPSMFSLNDFGLPLCMCWFLPFVKQGNETILTSFFFFCCFLFSCFVSFSLPTIQVSSNFNFLDSV